MSSKARTPEQAIRSRRIRLADRRAAGSLLRKAILLILALYVIFGILFGITPMKGGDMKPKLSAGDLLLYYRLQEEYGRNDVVLMKREGSSYVGRIIGMPGDTIEIAEDETVIINGKSIIETEIFYPTGPFPQATQYPLTLKEDEFFLMGDHRETARDSRYFGAVKKAELKGKVVTAVKRTDL